MQSINAGFQSLKTLIPHTDGEKLSKVGKSWEGFLEEEDVGSSREKEVSFSRRSQLGPPDLSLLPLGSHSPADGGVHLLLGAGEDQASAAEHTAQALHPGSTRQGLPSPQHLPSSWLPLPGMGMSGLPTGLGL